MTHEHDPYEAGLGFAVNLTKAVVHRASGPGRRRRPGRAAAPADLPDASTTRPSRCSARSRCTTASAASATSPARPRATRSGTGIAYAWLPAELAEPGRTVHIGYFDRRVPRGRREPLFDPPASTPAEHCNGSARPEYRLWRSPDPKPAYDVVIVGGGGHGLATAYYLAKNHGITNVAVLERGWLAGGNMARNTTIIRSNYLWDESAGDLRALAQALGEARAGARLRHPVQPARRAQPRAQPAGRARGRPPGQRQPAQRRRRRMARRRPRSRSSARSSTSPQDLRYPVMGATFQPRAGIAKHDHVAWGFARGGRPARRRPHPELRGHRLRQATAGRGVDQPRPDRRRPVALCAAGHTSVLAERPGSGCRCRATRCRPWSASCSSRCTTPS